MSAPDRRETWGPTVRGGRGRRRLRRGVIWTLVLVLLVPLLGGLVAGAYALTQLDRTPVEGLAGAGSPMHVLVTGSDSREGLSKAERRRLSTGSAPGGRSDTLFLMTIKGGDVALLAFPRDLYVELCDGSQGRINAAQSVDGERCLVETVSRTSGIDIHRYMSVSFGGFRDIVDAVGGVELCLDRAIQDADAGIDLASGCQVLGGRKALGYVRVRKIDNDLERIKRQQRFLGALADEMLAPSTLLNPLRLVPTAGETAQALTVDDGLGPLDIGRMALGLRGLAGGEAVTHTVPTQSQNIGGAAVEVALDDEAERLYASFRDGSVLDEAGAGPTRSDVRVDVRNGAGVAGLAAQTAERLREAGYEIGEVGNTEPRETSVIHHPPGQAAAADLLAGDVPGEPPVEERGDVDAVTLLLGNDAGQ